MKNKDEWHPTKFVRYKGRWRSSRELVGIWSRLNADRLVAAYEYVLTKYVNGDLVDLGCGNAPLAGIYKDRVSSFIWADWENTQHQEFNLDIEVDLNNDLPFEDESFDTVLLSDVIEHSAQPDALFSEVARILRPGGHIIIGVPFMYWLHEEPYDYHRYTRHKLLDFGNRAGLSVLELNEYAGGLDVVQDTLTKILAFSPITKWLAYIVHHGFNGVKLIPGVKGLNRKLIAKLPLGYVVVYQK